MNSCLDEKGVKFPAFYLQNYMLGDLQVMMHTMGVGVDLATRSFQNGTLDLPMLSRGYGTLVDQATPPDHAFLLI